MIVAWDAVKYGLERLNMEVAAWMRGDVAADGSLAPPPFLAMGWGALLVAPYCTAVLVLRLVCPFL